MCVFLVQVRFYNAKIKSMSDVMKSESYYEGTCYMYRNVTYVNDHMNLLLKYSVITSLNGTYDRVPNIKVSLS